MRGVPPFDRLSAMPSVTNGPIGRAWCALLLLTLSATAGSAQARPDLPWRTFTTAHFRVHFTPQLEPLARRTARNAELAWAELASVLVAPRGMVDLVVADNVDFANGLATPFPSNRIVVYARPPVEDLALRNHPDWNKALVTHELTHVFHLDRARGWWRVARGVFGRAAPFFPNSYAPAWITEGLAVHFETQFGAGGGRLESTEFSALVRAAALDGTLPALDAISLAAPRFPRGNVSYVYGAFAMTRADARQVRTYVELASGRLIPWRQDANARAAFGMSFTRHWQVWRDSVTRAESGVGASAEILALDAAARRDASGARTLSTQGYTARFPRFTSDSALVYVAEDGRRTTGLYALGLDGERHRLGRRTAVDANSPLAHGGTLAGEYDYEDPYTIRSDLRLHDARSTKGASAGASGPRRTRGARLSHPDVHAASGRVVAVRTIPGSTELVVLASLGDAPRTLAPGSLNLNWSEPRWSHDGTRVAASRWEDGGRTSIVVLGTDGRVERTFAPRGRDLAIVSSPVWLPGDTTLLFVSDHEGRPMIYRGDLRSGGYARVWATRTSLETPDVSPDGSRITAVELRGDGYHVVTRPMPGPLPLTLPAATDTATAVARAESARSDTTLRASAYSPWRTLLPHWWLPVIVSTDIGTARFGFETSGRDAVERHAYAGSVSIEPQRAELTGEFVYQYAGLGVPVLTASATQDWAHGVVRDSAGTFVGYLGRADRTTAFSATFQRPRARRSSALTLGGELSSFSYRTYPASLLPQIANGALVRSISRQAVFATLSFSTLQRPSLAVSVEDGLSFSVTQRQRFASGVNREDIAESIVSVTVAKSLPFPGFARHVLAARGAYGVTGHEATSGFGAGGVSGGSVEVVPTVTIGDARRTFFVRGFEGAAQVGVRAAAASVEYRAPLTLLGRGIRFLPVFFQKASLTAFADGGGAWCSRSVSNSFLCPSPLPARTTMASVGGELALDAALDYDAPYRFRLGVAHPVRGLGLATRATTVYFTLGSTF